MTSRKIENLSIDELQFLENLLSKKFNENCDAQKSFKQKNGWNPVEHNTGKLSRCLEAVRSQVKLAKLTQDKW